MEIKVSKFQNHTVYLPFVGEGAEVNRAQFRAILASMSNGVLLTIDGKAVAVTTAEVEKILSGEGITGSRVQSALDAFERASLIPDPEPQQAATFVEATDEELKAREKRISARLKARDKVKKDA